MELGKEDKSVLKYFTPRNKYRSFKDIQICTGIDHPQKVKHRIDKLERWGLLERLGNKAYKALPLEFASKRLSSSYVQSMQKKIVKYEALEKKVKLLKDELDKILIELYL